MKLNLAQAIALLLIVVTVLVTIQVLVSTVDINTLPANLQPFWQAVVIFFSSGAVIVAFSFLRNITGFIENILQGEAGASVQYEAKQLGATVTRFTAYVAMFETLLRVLFIGTPYGPYATLLAGGLGTIFDITVKAINDLATSHTTALPEIVVTAPTAALAKATASQTA